MSAATAPSKTPVEAEPSRASFWRKQLYTWHWMRSAVSLVGMLLFAVTGFTRNHARDIESKPRTAERSAQLPPSLLPYVAPDGAPDSKKPLPDRVATYVQGHIPLDARRVAEWTSEEIHIAQPSPGRDAWIAIDRSSGKVTNEATGRGWVAYFNDLHKGRNALDARKWLIDPFAFACLASQARAWC